jgi:hypothetical protein
MGVDDLSRRMRLAPDIRLTLDDGTPARLRMNAEPPETWLEYPLRDNLTAALRILPTPDGQLVIGEVRVFPDHPRREPGRWNPPLGPRGVERWDPSWSYFHKHVPVPDGGIPARVVHEVRTLTGLVATRRIMLAFRRGWGKLGVDPFAEDRMFGHQGFTDEAANEPKRTGPGRPPTSDEEVARIAKRYADLVAQGVRNPVQQIADEEPMAAGTVRDWIGAARARGILVPEQGTPGRAVGHLTTKGKELAKRRGGKR